MELGRHVGRNLGVRQGIPILSSLVRRWFPNQQAFLAAVDTLSEYYDPQSGGFSEAAFEQLPDSLLQVAEYVNDAQRALPDSIEGPNSARYGEIINRIQDRRHPQLLATPEIQLPQARSLLSNRKFVSQMKIILHDNGNQVINNDIAFTAPFPVKITGFQWKGGIELCSEWPVTVEVGMERVLDGNTAGPFAATSAAPTLPNTIVSGNFYRRSDVIWVDICSATPADNTSAVVGAGGDFDGFSTRWLDKATNTSRRLMTGDKIEWFINAIGNGQGPQVTKPWAVPGKIAFVMQCQFIVTFKKR